MDPIKLGSRVRINEHLVRAKIYESNIIQSLSEKWDEFPPEILKSINSNKRRSPWRLPEWKMWLPRSIFTDYLGRSGIRLSNRRYGDTMPWGLEFPMEGVVVRQANLQDGIPDNDSEYGTEWNQLSTRKGYKVAYSLHRLPITVYPSMIELLEEE